MNEEKPKISVYDPNMFEMFADRLALSYKPDGSATLHIFCQNDVFDENGNVGQKEIFQLGRIHMTKETARGLKSLIERLENYKPEKKEQTITEPIRDVNVR